MKALVTGACGFVAPYLMRSLVARGYDVTGTHVVEPKVNIAECSYRKLDICNFENCSRVISDLKPDLIFHLAGIAYVPEAESNFDRTMTINVVGTHNLIRVAHLLDLKSTFVFVSSAEVYGKFESLPITENQIPKPESAYSLSKLFAEQIVMQYHRKGTVKGVVARPFNHLGAGQDHRFMASSFAKQLSEITKKNQQPSISVGNLEAHRDFTDVRDIVEGYILAANYPGEVFNFCSGQPIQVKSILDTLIQISGISVNVTQDPNRMRASEIPVLYGSYDKAHSLLGWKPKFSLKETLTEVYNYWLNDFDANKK